MRITATAVFICFLPLLICCGKKNPTTPAPPKPRAEVKVDFKESTVWVYWSDWGKYYYSDFHIVVSEHRGVGGKVTTCKIEFYDDDEEYIRSATFSGGTFAPNGTLEIECHIEIREKFREMRAVVEGTDNNGYSFKAQKSLIYTLTDHLATAYTCAENYR